MILTTRILKDYIDNPFTAFCGCLFPLRLLRHCKKILLMLTCGIFRKEFLIHPNLKNQAV